MASDLIKNLPAERPASAIDLAKVWDNVTTTPFFSPEMIKNAGGMTNLFNGEFTVNPYRVHQEEVLGAARQAGKSILEREFCKMMGEDMRTIVRGAGATRSTGTSWLLMDELSAVEAAKIEDLMNGEFMAKAKNGVEMLSPEAVAALEHMAQQMTNILGTMQPANKRVTLASPTNLTVSGSTGYRKKNHIGGEEFEMMGVRVGSPQKGHRLIFEFKPTSVAEYTVMEMTQQECESGLNDWRILADVAAGGNFYVGLEEVRNIDAAKLREIERARLSEQYGEFGAW